MTLVIILFEGGISLRIQEILGTLRGASGLAILSFTMISILAAGMLMACLGEDRMTALVFGAIIGGLSPVVVLPLIRQISVTEKARTIVTIE